LAFGRRPTTRQGEDMSTDQYGERQAGALVDSGHSAVPGPRTGDMMPDDRLLTPAEVASLFGVDPRTVTRWATSGRLSPVRTPGGHRRYRRSEVLALRDSLLTN
jgi:excisionase family DNA binding protein